MTMSGSREEDVTHLRDTGTAFPRNLLACGAIVPMMSAVVQLRTKGFFRQRHTLCDIAIVDAGPQQRGSVSLCQSKYPGTRRSRRT